MKRIHFALFALALAGGAVVAAEQKTAETKEPAKQTHCPVMQRYPIDETMWVDIKGKRIYVCCKGCVNQIKANPDKYIKRLTDKGVVIPDASKEASKS